MRVGLLLPKTGILQLYGAEIEAVARVAEAEINANGGLLGRPLQVILEDDHSQPQRAVQAARSLVVDQQCMALIGGLFSMDKRAINAQVAEPLAVPYLSFTNYEGSVGGRYFFHFGALPQQHVDPMIRSVVARFGPKIFFAGHDSEWSRGSIGSALRVLGELSGEAIGEEYLRFGSLDFDDLVDRLARSGADAFVLFMRGPDFRPLLQAICSRALEGRIPIVLGQFDEAMLLSLPAECRYEYYTCNTYFTTVDNPSNRRFLASLREASGESPPTLTSLGAGTYLCVHALADAIARAARLDAEEIVEVLSTTRLRMPQGPIEMDPSTHHVRIHTYLARSKSDGRFEVLECYPGVEPTIPEQYRDPSLDEAQDGPGPATLRSLPTLLDEDILPREWPADVIDAVDAAVVLTRPNGTIVAANAHATKLFGHPHGELIGMNVADLMPPRFRSAHQRRVDTFDMRGQAHMSMGEANPIYGYRRDGSEFPADATVVTHSVEGEKYFVVTLRDATKQKRQEAALAWRAAHDPLTDLPNRRLIEERLARALGRAHRSHQHVALVLVDLDNFKLVNDSFGHAMGDELMKVIGERLLSAVRPGDTVGRFGGDEFLIICEQLASPDDIAPIASRVMEVVKRPCELQGQRLYVTASVGVTTSDGERDPSDMLREADAAMYAAKERGRDAWFVFNERLQLQSSRRLELAGGLRAALGTEQLRLHAQPILSADDRSIQGVELLLRWRHPIEGYIPPADIIPVAESTGLIVEVGRWVLEQACQATARWRALLGPERPFKTAVNLSARQLATGTFVQELERLLSRSGASASDLVIEMTESALFSDVDANAEALQQLGALGVTIAVDDFGTGYSSLSYLRKLPVHSLKIDKLFIDDVAEQRDSQSIVAAVIEMAHLLGLQVTAEGVEQAEQLNVLRHLGCDSLQGFLFFRPLALAEIEPLLLRDPDHNRSSGKGSRATSSAP